MRKNSDEDGKKQTAWLLIKDRDEHERPSAEYDVTTALPNSVSAMSNRLQPAAKHDGPAGRKSAKVTATPTKGSLPTGAVSATLPATPAPPMAILVKAPPAHTK